MQLADSFMDLPAWGFWGAVIAVAGIPIGVWAAFRAGDGRTRLYYDLKSSVRLIHDGAKDLIQVSRNGVLLQDPHVSVLRIVVKSRHDIREDAFSGGAPLTLDLSVPVISILGSRHIPEDGVPLAVGYGRSQSQNVITIGPGLIYRDAQVQLTVLTEGKPELKSPMRTLIDVELRPGLALEQRALRSTMTSGAIIVPPVFILYTLVLIAIGLRWSEAVGIMILAVCMAAVMVFRRVRARERKRYSEIGSFWPEVTSKTTTDPEH